MLARWEAANAFHAEATDDREGYSIVIPPPNVTAALHLGHALNNTLQDILTRRARMQGKAACWLPGTDHAGIATQTIVDKRLQAEGKPALKEYKKMELEGGNGRGQFLDKVGAWKDEYEKKITDQLKTMGCSCDWERQRFTMDPMCAKAVREAFFQLFKDGLIYRGKRLVNWDPVSQTALADDEVEMETIDGSFFYLKYPVCDKDGALTGEFVTVATTRPETMLGDTAVAVNPKDPVNGPFGGKFVKLPIVGRVIPIIADEYVVIPNADSADAKAKMSSGFLKVTPAHDPNDYALGQKYSLTMINVMAADASISLDFGWKAIEPDQANNSELAPFLGLSREEARKAIIRHFRAADLLDLRYGKDGIAPYRHAVGHSYRSHVPVEPYLSDQWYVKVTDERLAGAALRAMAPEQRTEGTTCVWKEGDSFENSSAPTEKNPDRKGGDQPTRCWLITFRTYGTWLPGDDRGFINEDQNIPGTPHLTPCVNLHQHAQEQLKHAPVELSHAQRRVTRDTIKEVCAHRKWRLMACNVRSNHVHVAVWAKDPDRAMNDFKSYATRRMKEMGIPGGEEKTWALHGSTRHLHTPSSREAGIGYVLRRQGDDDVALASWQDADIKALLTESAPDITASTRPLPDGRGSFPDAAIWTFKNHAIVDNNTDQRLRTHLEALARYKAQGRAFIEGAEANGELQDALIRVKDEADHEVVDTLHFLGFEKYYGARPPLQGGEEEGNLDPRVAAPSGPSPVATIGGSFGAEPAQLRFYPDRYAKNFQFWHENIRDWCISRQLWWGHRVPVWSKRMILTRENYAKFVEWPGLHSLGRAENQNNVVVRLSRIGSDHWMDIGAVTEKTIEFGAEYDIFICTSHAFENGAPAWEEDGFTQDPDVLDTWFSSALWPLSTFGWPENTPELQKWNPTDVLCTAREIITLWVSRMVMFNLYFRGTLPFRDVFIHAMIQDGHGQKMSKSLGNGVDPMDIIHSHGSDAMRFALAKMTTHTQDLRLPVDMIDPHTGESFTPKFTTVKGGFKVAAATQERNGKQITSSYGAASGEAKPSDEAPLARNTSEKFDEGKRFANKMWNAFRFALSNLEGKLVDGPFEPGLADQWILGRLEATLADCEKALGEYMFANYATALYDFFWRDLCDWYIESVKPTIQTNPTQQRILASCLDASLRLLHPVMPFITERLWERLNEVVPFAHRGLPGLALPEAKLLVNAAWPVAAAPLGSIAAVAQFEGLRAIVGALREMRTAAKLAPRDKKDASIKAPEAQVAFFSANKELIETFTATHLVAISPTAQRAKDAAAGVSAGAEIYLHGVLDLEVEKKRLAKTKGELEGKIKNFNSRLSNEKYVATAPPKLVQETRDGLATAQAELAAVEAQIEAL